MQLEIPADTNSCLRPIQRRTLYHLLREREGLARGSCRGAFSFKLPLLGLNLYGNLCAPCRKGENFLVKEPLKNLPALA